METQKFEIASRQSLLNKYLIAAFIIFSSLIMQVSPVSAQTPVG